MEEEDVVGGRVGGWGFLRAALALEMDQGG